MKIITISGLDGSGKSTQVELLRTYLESQGKKVFYFHAIKFGLANFISGHSERSEESRKNTDSDNRTGSFADTQDDTNNKSAAPRTELVSGAGVTKANFFQIILRRIFLMIDLIRFRMLLKKLKKENFDYLVSDRYFYDSIINIRYLAKSERWLPCEKFIVKPEFSFYLDAEPENIMQRQRKPDQGISYLQKKKELYGNAAPVWDLKTINGNRNKEEIFEELLQEVKNSAR